MTAYGITVPELASKASSTPNMVKAWKEGKKLPSLRQALLTADYLGKPVDSIWFLDTEPAEIPCCVPED
jgi:transcriptional regulator with XRE-family HTH domain